MIWDGKRNKGYEIIQHWVAKEIYCMASIILFMASKRTAPAERKKGNAERKRRGNSGMSRREYYN
jgi:hypothetical protein